jgi:phosphoribosylanthranilate isomerase
MLNSRNLFTLREGREHRDALARRLPAGVPFVLASSLATPEDAVLARALGGAVVVGGALMELGDSRSVEAWIARARAGGLLKACGAQDADDARSALAAGASLVGVNLIPSSKRCLQKEALAGFLEDDALLARTVFLTDAHTPRDLVDQINSSGKAFAYEQCYFSPRLLGAKGLFHVGAVAYLEEGANSSCPSPRARARILDSSLPGSGKVEPYVSHGLSTPRLPTLCAGGVSPETAEARAKEARLRGHAVCGFDAASGVERRGAQGTQNQDQRSGFDPDAVAFLATLAREL